MIHPLARAVLETMKVTGTRMYGNVNIEVGPVFDWQAAGRPIEVGDPETGESADCGPSVAGSMARVAYKGARRF